MVPRPRLPHREREDSTHRSRSGRSHEAEKILEEVDKKSVKVEPHIYSKFLA